MGKKRAYLLIEGEHPTPEFDAYTSFQKIYQQLSQIGYVPPYYTIYRRLQRAKEKGEKYIFIEIEGKKYTIEVHDLQ